MGGRGEIEIFHKELVHAIKSQDMQSASWRPRKSNNVSSVESGSLRTKKTNGINSSPSPKTEDQPMFQLENRQKERAGVLSHSGLFVCFWSYSALQGI